MLLTEDKNLLEVVHIRREVLGDDKDVIHVDKAEGKITQNFLLTFFWMSSEETGT